MRRTARETLEAAGIILENYDKERQLATCPKCSRSRQPKHQRSKCLGINITADGGVNWGCNHCGWMGPEKGNSNGAGRGNGRAQDNDIIHDYVDENGEFLFQKVRTPSKNYWLQRLDENGNWVKNIQGVRRVIYKLPEVNEAIAAGRTVVCVEGEKDCDNLWKIGVPATCNPDGASEPGKKAKWRREYSEMLRGADLIIMGDNDPAGRAHIEATASTCAGIARSVRVLDLATHWPDAPKGGDVSDWLKAGHSREELDALLNEAPIWELGATGEQPPPADEERAARSNGKVRPNGDAAGFAFDPQPYRFPDPASIPRRQWLHGRHYVRGVVSMTVGAPGRAKSTLDMTDVIGMASGRDLLNGTTLESGLLRAAYLNGEENAEELDRRVAAICKRYGIKPADCGDRLFVESTRDAPIKLAVPGPRTAAVIAQDAVDALARWCEARKLDVLVLDPLISFHQVRENDSGDMDLVCKEALAKIAGNFRAVEVVHHPRKPSVGQADTTTMDDARGSGAALGAIRIGRTLNFMSATEAAQLGIDEDARRLHVRIDGGKSNPGPLEKADWLRIETELLANGEYVACVTNWRKTDPFIGITTADMMKCREVARTGEFRFDPRAGDWIGFAVADALGIDVTYRGDNEPKDMARLKGILKTWFKNKVLVIDPREDQYRKRRNFVVPGPWKPEPLPPEQMGDDEWGEQEGLQEELPF